MADYDKWISTIRKCKSLPEREFMVIYQIKCIYNIHKYIYLFMYLFLKNIDIIYILLFIFLLSLKIILKNTNNLLIPFLRIYFND